jgi:hypothetical protein
MFTVTCAPRAVSARRGARRGEAQRTRLLQVLGALADALNLRVVLPLQALGVVLLQLLVLRAAEQGAAPAVAARGARARQPYAARRAAAAARRQAPGAHRLPRFMPPG